MRLWMVGRLTLKPSANVVLLHCPVWWSCPISCRAYGVTRVFLCRFIYSILHENTVNNARISYIASHSSAFCHAKRLKYWVFANWPFPQLMESIASSYYADFFTLSGQANVLQIALGSYNSALNAIYCGYRTSASQSLHTSPSVLSQNTCRIIDLLLSCPTSFRLVHCASFALRTNAC